MMLINLQFEMDWGTAESDLKFGSFEQFICPSYGLNSIPTVLLSR